VHRDGCPNRPDPRRPTRTRPKRPLSCDLRYGRITRSRVTRPGSRISSQRVAGGFRAAFGGTAVRGPVPEAHSRGSSQFVDVNFRRPGWPRLGLHQSVP
jgi:hypothetical protein